MRELKHISPWKTLSKENRLNIFNVVAESKGLSPEVVEKDWWLVLTLDLIFQMTCADALLFKGGTSLSKGWGLIERFSEDIDLALDRRFLGFSGELGKNQITKLRKHSVAYAMEVFTPELQKAFDDLGLEGVNVVPIPPKDSDHDPLKIDIYVPKLTVDDSYLKAELQVELGARSLREPFSNIEVKSFVGDKFLGEPFADKSYTIPIVNPERTFLEKILLLHEEHQRPEEKRRVDRLSRHLYDIYQLWKADMFGKAFDNATLFEVIVAHRERYSKVKGVDYGLHKPESIRFIPPESVLSPWDKDYGEMKESMIYGEKLSFPELLEALTILQQQINQIKWKQ